MRLVDDVVVPFSSVKFRIRIDGTQILLTEVGMESRAVQLPAAQAAWPQVVDYLDDDGCRFVAPRTPHAWWESRASRYHAVVLSWRWLTVASMSGSDRLTA